MSFHIHTHKSPSDKDTYILFAPIMRLPVCFPIHPTPFETGSFVLNRKNLLLRELLQNTLPRPQSQILMKRQKRC